MAVWRGSIVVVVVSKVTDGEQGVQPKSKA